MNAHGGCPVDKVARRAPLPSVFPFAAAAIHFPVVERMNPLTGLVFSFAAPFLLAATPTPPPVRGADPVETLWSVLVSGGLFMFPLAALLFLATLLIFIYLLTLRRGAVVTHRYLDICEALLRKRDYLGLLAVSNRHGESVARIVQAMLAFAKDNPTAPLASVREIAETEGIAAGVVAQPPHHLSRRRGHHRADGRIARHGLGHDPFLRRAGDGRGDLQADDARQRRFRGARLHGQRPRGGHRGVHRVRVFPRPGAAPDADLEAAATQILAVFSLYYAPSSSASSRAARTRTRGSVGRRFLAAKSAEDAKGEDSPECSSLPFCVFCAFCG